MKRVLLVALPLFALVAIFLWIKPRPTEIEEQAMSSEPADASQTASVPMGETVQRTLVDPEGNPEVWTISKREVERDQLDEMVLPSPAPRTSSEGAYTDSARALDARAYEAWKVGNIAEAVELFRAATEADPDDALAHSNFGRLLTLMSASAEALPHLERAAELEPTNPQVWIDLTSYYEKNLLLERALYARQRAEQYAAGRPIVRDESGMWRFEDASILP